MALALSLVLARWPIELSAEPKLLWAVALFGGATGVFALSTSPRLSMAALVISGAADRVSVVGRQSLVQLATPDAMRGRVSAVNSVLSGASNQLGGFESGATAALLWPVASVLLAGLGSIVVAGWWWRLFPQLAGRDSVGGNELRTKARQSVRHALRAAAVARLAVGMHGHLLTLTSACRSAASD